MEWEGTEQLKIAEPNLLEISNFYKELAQEIEDEKVLEQFLFDALQRDISDFTPNAEIPATEALREQRLHTLKQDSVGCWLYNLLSEQGDNFSLTDFSDEKPKHYQAHFGIPNSVMYKNYLDWCHKSKQTHFKIEHHTGFMKRIKKLVPTASQGWTHDERSLVFCIGSIDKIRESLGV